MSNKQYPIPIETSSGNGGGGGGGTPGGSNGDIQYNNSGSFGGSAATITAGGVATLMGITNGNAGSQYLPLVPNATSPFNELILDASSGFLVIQADSGAGANLGGRFELLSSAVVSGGAFVLSTAGDVIEGGAAVPGISITSQSGPLTLGTNSAQPVYLLYSSSNTGAVVNAGGILEAYNGGHVLADQLFPAVQISGSAPTSGQILVATSGTAAAWTTIAEGGGTVTSVTFTGDGTVLSSTPSAPVTTSGTLTATLNSAGGGTVLGNNTTGSAAPSYTTAPVLGIPGTSTGSVALASSTASGKYTITAPANAATPTLTLPTGTGTFCVSASSPLTLNATTGAMTFSGSGAITWDQIGNAAGALTLANGANATTFNQTSAVNWLWANTTTATSGTTNGSPVLELAANFWNGSSSLADSWTIGSSLAAGTNGASTLSINHSGSTGNVAVEIVPIGAGGSPSLQIGSSNVGLAATATSTSGFLILNYGSAASTGVQFYAGSTIQALMGAASGNYYTFQSRVTGQGILVSGDITTQTVPAITICNSQANNLAFTGTSGTQCLLLVGPNSGLGNTAAFAPTSGTAKFNALQVNPTINQTGGANGTVTDIMVNSVETAVVGTHNFLDLQAGSAGTTSKFTVKNSGIVTNYNAQTTARNGLPAILASSDLTAQTAAITSTNLLASAPYTGVYEIKWSADITTASDTSSVLGGANGFQVTYTSPTDSVAKTTVAGASITSSANTTATATTGSLAVYAKTGTAISFQYGYTNVSSSVAMVYELHISVLGL